MNVLKQTVPYYFDLPKTLIAKEPLEKRDTSKLLILDRKTEEVIHKKFDNLPDIVTENDVLVFNRSKVFPARLIGKKHTGIKVEVLLLYSLNNDTWRAISQPGLKLDTEIYFPGNVIGKITQRDEKTGEVDITFTFTEPSFWDVLEKIGQTPVPHYISSSLDESALREKYQTVYATQTGSVAAPTAGLHFTYTLLHHLKKKGVQMEFITLHVGLGTFQTLREEHFQENALHTEYIDVDQDTAERLNRAKQKGKRIIAVGTTTTRTLESIVATDKRIIPQKGSTSLFIKPPYTFTFVDSMITNFHLPYSSLLMLVSAFCSYPNTENIFTMFESSSIGKAYREAIKSNYRFYSFGDAMWIT